MARAREHPDEIEEADAYSHFVGETVIHKMAKSTSKYDLMVEFLNLNPGAASAAEESGLLPIAQAAVASNVQGFQKLLEVFPQGVKDRITGEGIHRDGTVLHVHICYSTSLWSEREHDKSERDFVILKQLLEVYPGALKIKNCDDQTPIDLALERHGDFIQRGNSKVIRMMEMLILKAAELET